MRHFDALPDRELTLGLGILFHDVGKPATFTRTDRIRFNGHDRVGAEMSDEILRRLRYPNAVVDDVRELVRDHMAFVQIDQWREAKLRRFLGKGLAERQLALHRLDCLGAERGLVFHAVGGEFQPAASRRLLGKAIRERDHDFGDDIDARWWHDAVRDLVVGLHALKADDTRGPTVAGVGARLVWAETVEERTTTGADVAAKWAEARAAIRAHPKYDGLDLAPQVGLVPLGPDPDSKLWEFGHPRTGDLVVRDLDTGRLSITEATGLVFVLIPAGTYRIGAQKADPHAPHYDRQADYGESPVHEVTLSPFFLSKLEMTQGQWARFTGTNPSYFRAGFNPPGGSEVTLGHPVEQVSWEMCRKTLDRLGLALPTEAQWEAACRAKTETAWSTGPEKVSLKGFANLADQAASRAGATWEAIGNWPELDDGFGVHAPVGSFQANGFGLHDMYGNVWEWCRDGRSGSYKQVTPTAGDGLRAVSGASQRMIRGGSFDAQAFHARSAARYWDIWDARLNSLGLRPARFVE